VGSFVWTYLTNLQETALPSKAELQGLLQDEILSSKFTPDIRKFSRNFELSSFYEDANLGENEISLILSYRFSKFNIATINEILLYSNSQVLELMET